MASVPSMFKVARVDFEDLRREVLPTFRRVSFSCEDSPSKRFGHNLLLFQPQQRQQEPVSDESTDSPGIDTQQLEQSDNVQGSDTPTMTTKFTSFNRIIADKASQIRSQVQVTYNTTVKPALLDWSTLLSHDLRLEALKESYYIILHQRPFVDKEEARISENFFLLFNSRKQEDAEESFKRLESVLRPLLTWDEAEVEENFLKDLIGLTGPLELNEMPKLMIKWCSEARASKMRVSVNLNAQFTDSRQSPLHIVSSSGQLDLLRNLVSLGADPSITDSAGNTVFHTAVIGGNLQCLEALLEHSSTALGPERLGDLLAAFNENGHTALMLAAIYNHFHCAYLIAMHSNHINQASPVNGNTALHIAAYQGHCAIAKLLAVYDADMSLRNKDNKTFMELADSSPQSGTDQIFNVLGALEVKDDSYSSETIPSGDFSLEGPILLSVDGGGIRGLVEVILLNELEAIMKERDPTFTYLSDYFDYIAGTSTGSYIVLGMSYHRYSMQRARFLYMEVKEQGNRLPRPYPDAEVNHFCKKVFSEDGYLSDVSKPRVIVTTTLANFSPPELHLMCNYGEPRQGQKGPKERKIWEAARASSAAPTYFEAFQNTFLDGGVMANNPTLDAMAEIIAVQKAAKEPMKIGLIVSLGTGVIPTKTLANINIQRTYKPASVLGGLLSLKSLFEVLVAQVTASDGQDVERAQAWCDSIGCPFFRFSPPIEYIELNESATEKLIEMMFLGLIYAKRVRGKLIRLADLLIQRKKKNCASQN